MLINAQNLYIAVYKVDSVRYFCVLTNFASRDGIKIYGPLYTEKNKCSIYLELHKN